LPIPRPSSSSRAVPRHSGPLDPALPRLWIQPHYASFNGLRAIAILLVFLVHFGHYLLPDRYTWFGWIGVDLFFVLSGFLITGILFDSLQDPHYFRNFYIRRALRIFPIFYTFFLLLFLLTPILHLEYDKTLLFFFFYVGNLTLHFIHVNPTIISMHFHGHTIVTNIGHLWSLCVEEQFYLVWPAVIWFVRTRKRLMQICVVASIIVLLLRIYLCVHMHKDLTDEYLIRWSTYTRVDTLLVGAWFALWLRERALSIQQLRKLAYTLLATTVPIFLLFRHMLPGNSIEPFIETFGFTLIALGGAGILLLCLDDSTLLARLLRNRYLYALGAISYGFYFIHHLFLYEVLDLYNEYPAVHRIGPLIPFLVFGVTLLLAKLSFRYLESPFLRMKTRLAPAWVPAPSPHDPELIRLHVSEPRP